MSNVTEIRQRLDRLTQLGKRMQEQFAKLSGPESEEMKKKAKKEGTRIGVGAGISFFGLTVAAVASVYTLAVIILLVNLALNRLWLSALIVVGGFLLLGGIIVAVGAGLVHSSAKELSRSTGDVTKEMKQVGEEMKAEVEELQKVAKKEAGERQKQLTELAETAKKYSPVIVGAFVGCGIVKRAVKRRRESRRILKVIELYEAARTKGELSEREGPG